MRRKLSKDVIKFITRIVNLKDMIIFSHISRAEIDFEIAIAIREYLNIQNPCPVGDKTDIKNLHRDDEE